jgi:hypothetical protein
MLATDVAVVPAVVDEADEAAELDDPAPLLLLLERDVELLPHAARRRTEARTRIEAAPLARWNDRTAMR